jgi:hypothetical protein
MKTALLAMASASLFAAATFCACSKDGDEDNSSPNAGKITVEVENGSAYSSLIDTVRVEFYNDTYRELVVLCRVAYNGGKFTLTPSENIDVKYFDGNNGITPPASLSVSNANARYRFVGLSAYKSGVEVGFFTYRSEDGSWQEEEVYATEDVNINGTDVMYEAGKILRRET